MGALSGIRQHLLNLFLKERGRGFSYYCPESLTTSMMIIRPIVSGTLVLVDDTIVDCIREDNSYMYIYSNALNAANIMISSDAASHYSGRRYGVFLKENESSYYNPMYSLMGSYARTYCFELEAGKCYAVPDVDIINDIHVRKLAKTDGQKFYKC